MDKGSLSLLGSSVHTYWVIRPNYERKVRFPFMLLNKSQPRPPRISQHQQGAGDLQIKRSHYLCAPPPHHDCSTRAPPHHCPTYEGSRREGTERVFVVIWGIKVFFFFLTRGGGGVLSTFLAWLFSAGIMWSAATHLSCPLVKFCHS